MDPDFTGGIPTDLSPSPTIHSEGGFPATESIPEETGDALRAAIEPFVQEKRGL
jgi:hypothetical protein